MKPKKFSLDFDSEVDFEVLGICAHLPDYRVVWNLNKIGNLKLERNEQGFLRHAKKDAPEFRHNKFEWLDSDQETEYVLLKNKMNSAYLVPALHLVDYFLIIQTEFESPTKDLKREFDACGEFVSVFEIDPNEHLFFQSIEHL
jgi:hypothetical protein